MSKGNIITPLIPDENIEVNKEIPETPKAPKDIYISSNSPENQKKEASKLFIKSCCKKWNCLEIIFLVFLIIIIFSRITSIIIQFQYDINPFICFNIWLLSFFCFVILFYNDTNTRL